MMQRGLSWAEMLDEAIKLYPALSEEIARLAEEIDSNIYGKYVDGTLTQQELESYYEKLGEWKRLSMQLFGLIDSESELHQ